MAIQPTSRTRHGRFSRWAVTGGLALTLALAAIALPQLTASAAVTVAQCNGGDGAGSVIACDVTVTNNLNGSVTSSTLTVARHCAGTSVICGETTGTTTSSTQLVTAIQQCNNAGNGGGSTLTCTVRIINNITASTTATPSTVNQCNGSGDGLGAPKVTCNPFPATTTGADITQCNNSANGGTLVGLNCTVSSAATTAAALPVSVNQCNGSDNGGGSLVTCSVTITNNITTPTPTPTPTPTSTPTPPPSSSSPAPGGATPTPGRTTTPPGTPPGGAATPGQGTTGGLPPVPDTGGAGMSIVPGGSLLLLGMSLLGAGIRRAGADGHSPPHSERLAG
ncbi:MAG: hypothetical protein NVSMB29_11620 [Candidatus Dormibacteria bacterium]